MTETTRRQFGLWNSSISPINLARGITFSDVAWDKSGALVWREGRSDRGVIVIQPADGSASRDLNSESNVRARVGYGGGDFCVAGRKIFFVEAESGRIFFQSLDSGLPRPLTPAFGAAAGPRVSPDGRWVAFIHSYEDEDVLALVDAEGQSWPVRLSTGNDFYAQPVWHPDSRRLAVITWNHPNMPWDGTTLLLVTLNISDQGLPVAQSVQAIAGGSEVSIFQPEFSPNGRYLAFASDETGWWQLYLLDLQSGTVRQLTSTPAEHAQPLWVQGMHCFGFSPDSSRLYFIRNKESVQSLWQIELSNGKQHPLPLDDHYTQFDQLAVSAQGKLAAIASGGVIPTRIVVIDPDSGDLQVIRRATSEHLPPGTYAAPERITWPGMDGQPVYGLFYAPHNPRYEGNGLPPLIVNVHGGPTSQRPAGFNLAAQFFASRGYAYLEVNYRGSTGYGRAYRNMLRGNWGIFDVQDSVSGARFLADHGRVDLQRMVIMGGSAGGFTVLKTLEDYPGTFKAGICLYGVSNQFTLASDTHKFEAHYSDSLIGPLPEAADRYRERSPIFFVDRIRDAIAIFQGEVDVVVPRAQSDEVVTSLQRRGVPHIYHLYPGEGHGFRKSENIEHLYRTIEKFLQQHVIFA
jgi:dipeptidyl aminopeptidase/acylaminoacyl peptidase